MITPDNTKSAIGFPLDTIYIILCRKDDRLKIYYFYLKYLSIVVKTLYNLFDNFYKHMIIITALLVQNKYTTQE